MFDVNWPVKESLPPDPLNWLPVIGLAVKTVVVTVVVHPPLLKVVVSEKGVTCVPDEVTEKDMGLFKLVMPGQLPSVGGGEMDAGLPVHPVTEKVSKRITIVKLRRVSQVRFIVSPEKHVEEALSPGL